MFEDKTAFVFVVPRRITVPEVPWKQIAGTRDRLIHGYEAVDSLGLSPTGHRDR